jgi:hypothetical protein
MKTNVLESSIEAYHSDKMHHNWLTEQIENYALKHKRFTCKMIAHAIGVDASTVSGRIKNHFIPSGLLFRELSKHPCPITGNNAFWLSHKNYTNQQSLFN